MPSTIQIISARDFAGDAVDVSPASALRALGQLSGRHTQTPHTPAEILDILFARYRLKEVGEILRPIVG